MWYELFRAKLGIGDCKHFDDSFTPDVTFLVYVAEDVGIESEHNVGEPSQKLVKALHVNIDLIQSDHSLKLLVKQNFGSLYNYLLKTKIS